MDEWQVSAEQRDDDHIRAAVEGDLEAFGVLVERYEQVAFRAAWLVLRDDDEAQDVCQEAFLRAHAHLGRFRVGEPFRPWLLRIVTNLARNQLRSRRRRRGLLERLTRRAALSTPAPERAIEVEEERDALLDAIAALPAPDREVLHLRYFLDLSEAEMAVVLGIRAGTVKSRLSRARGRLRARIEEHHPELARPSARPMD